MTPDSLRAEWGVPPTTTTQASTTPATEGDDNQPEARPVEAGVEAQANQARGKISLHERSVNFVTRGRRLTMRSRSSPRRIPKAAMAAAWKPWRAGEARAAAIRQRHAATQAQGTEIAETGERTTFFIRDGIGSLVPLLKYQAIHLRGGWHRLSSVSLLKPTVKSVPSKLRGRNDSTRLEPCLTNRRSNGEKEFASEGKACSGSFNLKKPLLQSPCLLIPGAYTSHLAVKTRVL